MNSKLLAPTRSGSRNVLTLTAALAAACILSAAAAWAQAPAAAGSAASSKVGVISIRQAIVTTAEGKVASAELQSQFASRQNEIENLNKQISDLQQRLQAGANKLSQEEEARLRQQGQRLAQRLDRMNTEYQEDVNAAQADVFDRIGRKMVDVLDPYARENGFNGCRAMSIQDFVFEVPVAQDLPGDFDEIQCPQPFDETFRPDFVDHYRPDDLIVAKAFTRKQEGL